MILSVYPQKAQESGYKIKDRIIAFPEHGEEWNAAWASMATIIISYQIKSQNILGLHLVLQGQMEQG